MSIPSVARLSLLVPKAPPGLEWRVRKGRILLETSLVPAAHARPLTPGELEALKAEVASLLSPFTLQDLRANLLARSNPELAAKLAAASREPEDLIGFEQVGIPSGARAYVHGTDGTWTLVPSAAGNR